MEGSKSSDGPITNAIILVGGGGTRLRPLTYAIPKPLIPVLNRPLITHLLLNLSRHGVKTAVLAGSASDHRLEEVLGDGSDFGLRIIYEYEDEPLGSGLAVKQAAQHLQGAFFVCNGDVVADIDLSAMSRQHRDKNALLSISLSSVDDPSGFGVVALGTGDRITRFVEKPPRSEAPSSWANAGTWIFEPEVLNQIPDERMDRSLEQLVFPSLIAEGAVVQGFRCEGYWMDVGTSERYLKLHQDLLRGCIPDYLPAGVKNAPVTGEGSQFGTGSKIGPYVLTGASVHIDGEILGPTVMGDGVIVEAGATVEGSILWSRVRVGADAIIRDSIIGQGCWIGQGAVIESAVIADGALVKQGVHLSPGARLEPKEVAG